MNKFSQCSTLEKIKKIYLKKLEAIFSLPYDNIGLR